MRIITIGREFGSGGRELGKRLADALGVPCYDKEVIHEVAKLHGLAPEYVDNISPADIRQIYPTTIGHTLGMRTYYNNNAIQALISQQDVIKTLAAGGDCIFVGRAADCILRDMHPLNIFVYADKESKLRRCMEHMREGETAKGLLKQMQKVDRDRATVRQIMTDQAWGKKETYHLCVNTSGTDIKSLIPPLAQYARSWFEIHESKK